MSGNRWRLRRGLYSLIAFTIVMVSGLVWQSFAAESQVDNGVGAVSSNGMMTWPQSGQYTTALFTLAQGRPACIVLLKPRPDGLGLSYDVSIWRQQNSIHLWVALHGGTLPDLTGIRLSDGNEELAEVPVSKHSQPALGIDALMTDISEDVFDKQVRPHMESGHDLSLTVGVRKFRIPADGLPLAMRQLHACTDHLRKMDFSE